jgi:peptidoglycan/xylan/chitin deacetylase (PgdA/CDA1 family)
MTALWAAPAAADTTVSLTFDDGNADQMTALPMLADHGMKGTFYIIPGRVGRTADGYMSWSQVDSIFAAGHEIGGHTRNHVHLNQVNEATARTEICGGRDDLLARGYPQMSFAYPFGDHDATSEELVQECGYLSGRGVSGLGGDGEPKAETIPPRDPWVVRTRGSVDVDDTLDEIEDWIIDAEAVDDGNGTDDAWMNLVFHHLCDPDVSDCDGSQVDGSYITPDDFDALLDWLQARSLTGTHVKTIAQVMTPAPPQDTTAPVTQIRCDGATCQSGFYDHSVSATLSATDTGGSGLKEIRYTTNGSNPTTSSTLYTGPIPVNSTTTIKYRAWDNAGNAEAVKSQAISIDTAKPTSSILCDDAACSASFYNHSVSATLSGNDTGGSGLKNIRYTTNGTDPTASSPIYSGAIPVNSTTTIKWRAEDNAGNIESPIHSQAITIDTAKPTSSILCDGGVCEPSYDHAVEATLSGTDTGGSGLKSIHYTTDGSTPDASDPSVANGGSLPISSTTTIKFRAEDNAGNLEAAVNSQTIEITSTPPGGGGGGPIGGAGGASGTLGAFASSQSLPNGTVKLTVEVTGPGELEAVDASVAGASAVAAKKRTPKIKPTSQSVAQAGEVTLTFRASKAGKKILKRKGKLTVPVRITFTPVTGSPADLKLKLKFRINLKT